MKSLIKPFTAMLLVCLYFTVNAEKNETPAIITGTIIEKSSNQPVPYANVALVHKDTGQIVTGIMTNENGNFTLNGLPRSKVVF